MILMHPGNPPMDDEKGLAERSHNSLDGLRLGLLGNAKLNADNVLNAVGDLLAERYNIVSVFHRTKPSFSKPAPDDMIDEMVENCDLVISGVGD